MSSSAGAAERRRDKPIPLLLGGYAALAETAWMGVAQATDVLEPVRVAAGRWLRARRPARLVSHEFTIIQATALLMGSFFFSALLGAVRQVLFNAQFGAGSEANAYYAAFRLPDLLFSLVAGGALSSAMIPVLATAAAADGQAAEDRLASLVLSSLLAVFAIAVLVGELFTPAFVGVVLAPGFDTPTSELTIVLTRIMLVQPVVLAIGSVATAVLNGRNQFLLTGLSVASHNVCLIAGILSGKPPERRRGRMHSSGDLPGRCSQSTGLHCPHRRPRGAGRGTTSASLRSARVWRDVSPLHGPDQ